MILIDLLIPLALIITNPLENIDPSQEIKNIPLINTTINNEYISTIKGFVKEVSDTNGSRLTCIVANESFEFVYTGLDIVYKKKGDPIQIGEPIGLDKSITEYTKYILIEYRNLKYFPQFEDNKVIFPLDQGTHIHAPFNSIIENIDYDFSGKGNYIKLTNNTDNVWVEFWHMQAFRAGVQKGQQIARGDLVGYSGNMGLCTFPRVCLQLNDTNLFGTYKIIYAKTIYD